MNTPPSNPLLARLRRSLDRDRDLPPTRKLQKALRFGAAAALAPLYLIGCDRVGPGARTRGRPVVRNAGRLTLGPGANLCSTFAPVHLVTRPGGVLQVGAEAFLNFGCTLSAASQVTLGDRVSLGPYVSVVDTDPDGEARPIRIGADVWLAARVRVHGGAVIGDGAVITAGSEVVGEIPARCVGGGVPARVIRRLDAGAVPSVAAASPGALPPAAAAGPVAAPSAAPTALHRAAVAASHAFARLALRGVDALGPRPFVRGLPFVENLGRLTIGADLSLASTPVGSHLVTGPRGVLRIGDGVIIGPGAAIAAEDRVEIGDGARLGAGVMLLASDYHAVADRDAPGATGPIVIGAHAHLGDRVVVLHGATIGAHAVIAADSVVSGDIPAGAHAAGVPALVIPAPAARAGVPALVIPAPAARAAGVPALVIPAAAPAPQVPPVHAARAVLPAVARVLHGIAPEADATALAPDASLREALDLDSMDFLRFVAGLHRELGVEVPEADYPRLATLGGCQDYLAARLSS
jgi:acetyltransferase-like isoleucine patch superfamily enzyme/acyl carrier protein